MNPTDRSALLLLLIDRIPDVCLIETDAAGIFTRFGPAAERFFGCSAEDAVGLLHYRDFHDPAEMEACRDDPAFREEMQRRGWTEETWRVIPHRGEPFTARVTLMRAVGDPPGWMALYRRISGA